MITIIWEVAVCSMGDQEGSSIEFFVVGHAGRKTVDATADRTFDPRVRGSDSHALRKRDRRERTMQSPANGEQEHSLRSRQLCEIEMIEAVYSIDNSLKDLEKKDVEFVREMVMSSSPSDFDGSGLPLFSFKIRVEDGRASHTLMFLMPQFYPDVPLEVTVFWDEVICTVFFKNISPSCEHKEKGSRSCHILSHHHFFVNIFS